MKTNIYFALLSISALLMTGSPDLYAKRTKSNKVATPVAKKSREAETTAAAPVSESNGMRVALVIGNADYINSPLTNPVNDATDVAVKLRGLGFDVVEKHNIKMREIGRTLSEFRQKLKPGAVALVFYAGHGIQIKGENYFPAVDAEISVEDDVPNQSIAIRQIMDVLDGSKTRLNLVFLDACRNNPYTRQFRSAESGLARVAVAPSGTLISYATRPGSVAADGEGRNGLYTSQLLEQLESNEPIELTLKELVKHVKTESKGKQEPWMEGSIEGEFCFKICVPESAKITPTPTVDPIAVELSFWDSIKNSTNPDDFQAYLDKYPQGQFAALARNRLKPAVIETPKIETPTEKPAPLDIEMVDIEGGCYMMGSPANEAGRYNNERQHQVCVKDFQIGKYEVSQALWWVVMGNNPSKFKGDNLPVEQVSWDDVQMFLKRLNQRTGERYRLITEAEWEYAARAGTTSIFYTGECIDSRKANYDGSKTDYSNSYANCGATTNVRIGQTTAVGAYPANSWGLYDMAGNVWEWLCSEFVENYNGLETQCAVNKTNDLRVVRSGGWGYGVNGLRTAIRWWSKKDERSEYIGFRLAK